MDAANLQEGFRVGDWIVEPRERTVTSGERVVALTDDQLRLLLALAAAHGETIDRRTLRSQLWPGAAHAEERLRRALADLRAIFGDTPRHRRYIASVGHDGVALVAHFERVPIVVPPAPDDQPATPARPMGARLHGLLGELRRRNVVKVAASYLLVMWITLQVAEVTFAPLRFPDWWMTALTIIAIIGLPIVVALAWAYEITPQGIVVDAGGAGAVRLPRPRQSLAPAIVAGVALMAGVTGLAWWRTLETAPLAEARAAVGDQGPVAPSIAVLPFADMSQAGTDRWLGDGLSEELATRLAQVPGLRVASRTSAFEFRDRSVDVRKIGESLGVRHVLEGSVRRDGDALRVTVQLIDARTGYHVWAGNFDRAWQDLLSLQDEVARSVTDELQVVLSGDVVARPVAAATSVDVRALGPYLEGHALLRQPGDPSVLQQAEAAFRSVVQLAPKFAAAHAGLCRALVRRFESSRDPAALAGAETSCRRALELDPSLVDTERALAAMYVSDSRFNEAVALYRKLLARSPSDVVAQLGLADAMQGLGLDDEAERSLRRAVAIDPADSASHSALGRFLFHRGRVDEAVASFRRSTELAPSSATAWSNLGGAAQLQGDTAMALEAYRKSLLFEKSATAYSNLGTAQYYSGRHAEAVENFERAVAMNPHELVLRANLADALWAMPGRRQEAVALYRQAIETGEADLARNPGDATLRAQLGFYYGRVGDRQRSEHYIAEAVTAGADKLYVQYYRAVAAADRGDRRGALDGVEQLLRVGYPRAMLLHAPEFRRFAGDPEYLRLLRAKDAA